MSLKPQAVSTWNDAPSALSHALDSELSTLTLPPATQIDTKNGSIRNPQLVTDLPPKGYRGLSLNQILIPQKVEARQKQISTFAYAAKEIVRLWVAKQMDVSPATGIAYQRRLPRGTNWIDQQEALNIISCQDDVPNIIAEIRVTRARHCDHGARSIKRKQNVLADLYPHLGAFVIGVSIPRGQKVRRNLIKPKSLQLDLDRIRADIGRGNVPQVIIAPQDLVAISRSLGFDIEPHLGRIYGKKHWKSKVKPVASKKEKPKETQKKATTLDRVVLPGPPSLGTLRNKDIQNMRLSPSKEFCNGRYPSPAEILEELNDIDPRNMQKRQVAFSLAVEELVRNWVSEQINVANEKLIKFQAYNRVAKVWFNARTEIDILSYSGKELELLAEIKTTRIGRSPNAVRQAKIKRKLLQTKYHNVGAFAISVCVGNQGRNTLFHAYRNKPQLDLDQIRSCIEEGEIPEVIIPRKGIVRIGKQFGVDLEPHLDAIYD